MVRSSGHGISGGLIFSRDGVLHDGGKGVGLLCALAELRERALSFFLSLRPVPPPHQRGGCRTAWRHQGDGLPLLLG